VGDQSLSNLPVLLRFTRRFQRSGSGCTRVYYVVAARSEATAYFRASVWLRAAFLVATLALVALGLAPAPIIGFGIVDLLGAVWTALSLRAAGFEVHERTAGVELPGSE
jgi:hypothetical protein